MNQITAIQQPMPEGACRPVKRLTILGATGSIGQSTLDVVGQHRDAFQIEALVANSNIRQLAADAIASGAKTAVTADPTLYAELADALGDSGITAAAGPQAVIEAAQRPVDLIVAAIVGA